MPATVLIVDDEPHMLRIAELSLKRGGFHLLVGRNGRQAIELATRHLPDLIVMDVLMPEVDGLTALRRLKADPVTADIPVIMITARGHVMTRQEAEEYGAALFLTKPFSPTQLLLETRRLIAPPSADCPAEPVAAAVS
ncbi:MAG: response regulator [Verrucomicrobiae bacterium]|nr:response regulator [Verrucomicrobiae bacterium]